MLEHITQGLYYFEVHLLYASIVGLVAGALTSVFRASATTKYWIWVATSLNFIVPVGAVLDKSLASHLAWARPLGMIGDAAASISQGPAAPVFCAIWLLGTALMFTRLFLRIRADGRNARLLDPQSVSHHRPSLLTDGIPVSFANHGQAPAVDGVLHPRISLPSGIERLLSEPELDAVLIHELAHAKRRDNLIRLVQEVALCILWFHPLVWITGSRLALYRELSCDESVIQSARGRDLVSALAKLADPERPFLLQATASSFISHRLAGLTARPRPPYRIANALVAAIFFALLAASAFATVAHTACCFAAKK